MVVVAMKAIEVRKLIDECERKNNADSELIRINKNTWVKKSQAKEQDFKQSEKYVALQKTT